MMLTDEQGNMATVTIADVSTERRHSCDRHRYAAKDVLFATGRVLPGGCAGPRRFLPAGAIYMECPTCHCACAIFPACWGLFAVSSFRSFAMLRFFMLIFSLLLPVAALAEGKSIIVLDASGLMWGRSTGVFKLEIAREALKQVLGELPADSEVADGLWSPRKGIVRGYRAAGSPRPRYRWRDHGGGGWAELSWQDPLTKPSAAPQANCAPASEKATVILITDGIETCARQIPVPWGESLRRRASISLPMSSASPDGR